ncbi:hypothetical protein DX928_06115 [Bacillus swezeyi]|nr:hypothetical protein DX928_06115 [Bacillus swezeyi]
MQELIMSAKKSIQIYQKRPIFIVLMINPYYLIYCLALIVMISIDQKINGLHHYDMKKNLYT